MPPPVGSVDALAAGTRSCEDVLGRRTLAGQLNSRSPTTKAVRTSRRTALQRGDVAGG
jgi:hypothetical protein